LAEGRGALIPGISDWYGIVNETNYKFSLKDIRHQAYGLLDDPYTA
jgi:hypothetical protein